MIERHQDYQLNIATLPAGGLQGVELLLDSDAAFATRLVKQRYTPGAPSGGWSYRFRAPSGAYQSSDFRFDTFGRGTLLEGNPLYPQMIYPANGSIVVDINNVTGVQQTNVKLLFRGSKLFPDGSMPAPTYPAVCSILPQVLPVQILTIPQNNGSGLLNNQINAQIDWDFALRYANADPFSPTGGNGTYDQLYVQLKDQTQKPYSNVPIHIDDLFGSQSSTATGSTTTNPFWPGLFLPEIYVPANGILYFDIFRTDTGGGNVTMQFSFGGVKVYRR